MRPSKLRLPESTAATTNCPSSIARDTASGNGPEFPMQVVHPYPTTPNPSFSRSDSTPDRSKYSVTTLEPGASDVLTHGLLRSPSFTAFRARRPAASMTEGFAVFVQLVMAAITTPHI